MSRAARVVVAGLPHHVTHRGNNRRVVFQTDRDRSAYLNILRDSAVKKGLRIWGYCLMDNHVHLIVVPEKETSLAAAMRAAHGRNASYANAEYGMVGHFWQNRCHSCPMDRHHGWVALAYVEQNPVRAGIVKKAEDFAWSSARAHVEANGPGGFLDFSEWLELYSPQRWATVL